MDTGQAEPPECRLDGLNFTCGQANAVLTKAEARVLEKLLSAKGRTVATEHLVAATGVKNVSSLHVIISLIRKKVHGSLSIRNVNGGFYLAEVCPDAV